MTPETLAYVRRNAKRYASRGTGRFWRELLDAAERPGAAPDTVAFGREACLARYDELRRRGGYPHGLLKGQAELVGRLDLAFYDWQALHGRGTTGGRILTGEKETAANVGKPWGSGSEALLDLLEQRYGVILAHTRARRQRMREKGVPIPVE